MLIVGYRVKVLPLGHRRLDKVNPIPLNRDCILVTVHETIVVIMPIVVSKR
jgi:hypothetical protein